MKKPKKIIHRSWAWKRTLYTRADLERAFADEWEVENVPLSYLNQGQGTLQNLLLKEFHSIFRTWKPVAMVNNRDAMIAATVVQWLGTNCGFAFMERVLRKCGMRIETVENKPDSTFILMYFSAAEWKVVKSFRKMRFQKTLAQLISETGFNRRKIELVMKTLQELGFATEVKRPAGKFWTLTKSGESLMSSVESPGPNEGIVTARFWISPDFPRKRYFESIKPVQIEDNVDFVSDTTFFPEGIKAI